MQPLTTETGTIITTTLAVLIVLASPMWARAVTRQSTDGISRMIGGIITVVMCVVISMALIFGYASYGK